MAKDPFSNIPPIQDQPAPDRPQARAQADAPKQEEDITKGSAPRNLFKSVGNLAIPIGVVALVVWMMIPTENGPKKAEAPAPTVDPTRQVAQTTAMIDEMKENAAKTPAPAPTPQPQATVATSSPMPPMAPLPLESPDLAVERARAEAERRAQDIRSSPLEAGSFKLLGEGNGESVLPKPAAFDVQAQLAAHNAARLEATRTQDQMLERALAAHSDSAGTPQSRSPNVTFLEEQSTASKEHDVVRQQPSASRYLVNQGTVIRAVLLTGVNSDLPGTVKAQVTSDVYDSTYQRHVLIPKGSTMIGAYNSEVRVGQERLMMAMTRMILPNGSWISLAGAPGSDRIGQSGVDADVNNHFWKIFGTSLVLGAASTFLPDRQQSISTTRDQSGVTQGGTVFGMALNETLRTLLERNKNIAPTLTLHPGQEFTLLVAKDMILHPYR